nr:MAG TPA: hypothetical protein [Caudoviricetes sp.]
MIKIKAYGKRRLSVAQQETIRKAAASEFVKYKEQYEKKCNDRNFFLFFLTLAMVLDEELNFGEQRRAKIIKACMDKIEELSNYLVSNTCEIGSGNERFDTEYNLATLERLANQYHIAWDENIFNDDIEERGSTNAE